MKAIVTGATRGIGLAITKQLLEAGYEVAAVGRSFEKLEPVKEQYANRLFMVEADLLKESAETVISKCFTELGSPDILINNAGMAYSASIEDTTEEIWDRIMQLNAKVPFFLSQAALPLFKEKTKAFIINIASVVADRGYKNQAAYSASKHALLGWTKVLAKEVQCEGIRVHTISPGGVATEMVTEMRPDINAAELISPQEVAETVLFLLQQKGNAVIDEIKMRRETKEPWY